MTKSLIAATKADAKAIKANLGQTIYNLRKTAKISQTELGDVLSLHQTAVCRVEQGGQNLTPEELFLISKIFDVKIDSLLAGEVDYWKVAERFGRNPPFPERYRIHPHSKLREVLPVLQFLRVNKGVTYLERFLERFHLKPSLLVNPDQTLGVNCKLDLLRTLIEDGEMNRKALKRLVAQTRTQSVQGFLHSVYETQEASLALVQNWILNAHHYETNFRYEIESLKSNSLVVSVAPASHMKEVQYKDEVLGDFLCEYKKGYFSEFPKYIDNNALHITEKECHFHGSSKCVYTLTCAA